MSRRRAWVVIPLLIATCVLAGYGVGRWQERHDLGGLNLGGLIGGGPRFVDYEAEFRDRLDWGFDTHGFHWRRNVWDHEESPADYLRRRHLDAAWPVLTWPADWPQWRGVPLPRAWWGRRQSLPEQRVAILLSSSFDRHGPINAPAAAATPKVLRVTELRLPYWLGVMLGGLLTLGLVRPWQWLHRRVPSGHCPSCGYDCRATPGRCSECEWELERRGGATEGAEDFGRVI
jgi:hypothetical protein